MHRFLVFLSLNQDFFGWSINMGIEFFGRVSYKAVD
jgi:hypothetical protein